MNDFFGVVVYGDEGECKYANHQYTGGMVQYGDSHVAWLPAPQGVDRYNPHAWNEPPGAVTD